MSPEADAIIAARDAVEKLVGEQVARWRRDWRPEAVDAAMMTLAAQVGGWFMACVALRSPAAESFIASAAPEIARQMAGNAMAIVEGETAVRQ